MENRQTPQHIPDKVRDLIDRIAENYKPEKIALFGSYAWGAADEWSDMDLLIIKDTDTKKTRRAEEALKVAHDGSMSIDVIVVTPKELDWVLKKDISFIGRIMDEGMTVYEQ
jgi:predicted nucleotidyltransferase